MVERVIQWVKQNTAVSAVLGGAVVLALVLGGLGGGDPEPVADPTTTTGDGFDIFGREEEPDDLAGVPTLDCSLYLTIGEVGDALTPAGQEDLADVLLRARNEVCTFTAQGQDGFFVRLEPGAPADFEGGGSLLGTSGEPVNDVGDDARWFGGPGAEGGGSTGSISVRQSTPLGLLHFRVYLGRPDLESGAQLEIARDLALAALPRFPGMPLLESIAVDLCELVSDGEAEAVLAEYRDVHPATRDEILVGSQSAADVDLTQEGESQCTKLILAEIYIRVEQGSLDDFEAGAEYEGVPGEEIAGVGDAATWFADVPYQTSFTAPHTLGVLAVRIGESAFRIALAVPDTPAADQLEIVTGLATSAVSRITGADPAGDPVIIEPQESEPPVGLVENLLAREEAGDWTLGEGLAATLGWFVGDVDSSQVISGEPSPFELGDDVLQVAFDYLNSSPEDPSREKVEGLLRQLITTPGRLAATGAIVGQPPEAAFRLIRVSTSHDDGYKNTLDSSDYCWDVYGVEGGNCLQEIEIPDLDPEYADDYQLLRPVSDFVADWAENYFGPAAEAIAKSAEVLERRGDMPAVAVLFTKQHRSTVHYDIGDEEFCEIHIGSSLRVDIPEFQQQLAHSLALCLFHEDPDAWWRTSMAVYFSGVIFPEHDIEHKLSPILSGFELSSVVGERGKFGWLFWEFLHPSNGGEGGNLSLARSAAAPADMAGYPGMDILLRDFYRSLTDATVPDLGFGLVPYEPMADVMQISGPLKPVNLKPREFGVKRLRLEVVGHDYACVSITPQGDAQLVWREGREGQGQGGTIEPPSAISGESVLTVTTASGSGFVSLQVKDVGDNPECEDEPEEPTEFNPPPLQCPFCDLSRYFRNSGS